MDLIVLFTLTGVATPTLTDPAAAAHPFRGNEIEWSEPRVWKIQQHVIDLLPAPYKRKATS
jgi:hypothetical protein